jgi:hypothetical protein
MDRTTGAVRCRPLPQSLTVVPEEMMCPNQQVAISEQLPLYRILNQVVFGVAIVLVSFL